MSDGVSSVDRAAMRDLAAAPVKRIETRDAWGNRLIIESDPDMAARYRTDVPALLDALERAEAENARLRETNHLLAVELNRETNNAIAEGVRRSQAEAERQQLRDALQAMLPRYEDLFVAAGLGAPEESVAIIVARAALGDADAWWRMAENGWTALGEAAPATRGNLEE